MAPGLLIGLGCLAFGLFLGVPILIALLLPAVQAAREAARRSQCNNNLKQIGLALQSYADINKAFPPGYVADENGRPMHSWRVLILPYIEQKALYDRYDFNEPWDGPNNSQLAGLMPPPYRCPSDSASAPPSTITSYAAISGPGTMFDADTPSSFATIRDGTSNTIAVAEASGAGIHWMEPRDLDVGQMTFQVNGSAADISSPHPGGAMAVFADGHTTFLGTSVAGDVLRALFTKNGGEPINGNF
jgi:prepilin-type processing-associated H-X9-DG protein